MVGRCPIAYRFPFLSYFSVVVCLRWLYHHMPSVSYIYIYIYIYILYISGKLGFVLLLLCSLMMRVNNIVHYDPIVVFVFLHITLPQYQYYEDVSEVIELWKFVSATLHKSVCSIILHAIHQAVCIQLIHFLYEHYENTYTSSDYHHQFGSMIRLPLLRVR